MTGKDISAAAGDKPQLWSARIENETPPAPQTTVQEEVMKCNDVITADVINKMQYDDDDEYLSPKVDFTTRNPATQKMQVSTAICYEG